MKTILTIFLLATTFAFAGLNKHIIPKRNNNLTMDNTLWWLDYWEVNGVFVPAFNPEGIGATRRTPSYAIQFTVPTSASDCATTSNCNAVEYLQTWYTNGVTLSAASAITMTFTVNVTSGVPAFDYVTATDNTCIYAAHVRFLIETLGDNLCGLCPWPPASDTDTCCQYLRWWSNPMAVDLSAATGTVTLTVSLNDLTQWSSVAGRVASDSLATQAGFAYALQNVGQLGMTFGGGCFFGHGVFIDQGTGTANFVLTNFKLVP